MTAGWAGKSSSKRASWSLSGPEPGIKRPPDRAGSLWVGTASPHCVCFALQTPEFCSQIQVDTTVLLYLGDGHSAPMFISILQERVPVYVSLNFLLPGQRICPSGQEAGILHCLTN